MLGASEPEGAAMAKVLERSSDLYDADLLAWLEQQASLLRAGQLDRLDVIHLIEELEDMGGSQRREIKNRLEILLMHMLKCDASPRRRSRSWESTIVEQRARIADLLEQSPSLRNGMEEVAQKAFAVAVRRAAIETGLKRSAFPAALPYRLAAILEDGPDTAPTEP
jgi:Domain of unknown function DUF29